MTEYEGNQGSGFSGADSVRLDEILKQATDAADRAEMNERSREVGVEDNIESSEAFYHLNDDLASDQEDFEEGLEQLSEEFNELDDDYSQVALEDESPYEPDSHEEAAAVEASSVTEEYLAPRQDVAIEESSVTEPEVEHHESQVENTIVSQSPDQAPTPSQVSESSVAKPIRQTPIAPVRTPEPAPITALVSTKPEAVTVELIDRVIRILENFRNLSEKEKSVAIQFMSNDHSKEATEAEVAILALNADPMIAKTMKHLRDSYEMEPVDRAFHIMSLTREELHSLGSLVAVFTSKSISEDLDDLTFGKALVSAIANLDDTSIGYVRGTESVLTAAQG